MEEMRGGAATAQAALALEQQQEQLHEVNQAVRDLQLMLMEVRGACVCGGWGAGRCAPWQ